MNTKRPLPVAIAVVLLALFSVLNFISPLLPTDYPTIVLFLGGALGVVGLLAAAGLWQMRRWGLLLTIIVSVLNILLAAPGDIRRARRHGQTPRGSYDRGLCPRHRAGDAVELATRFRGYLSFRDQCQLYPRPLPSACFWAQGDAAVFTQNTRKESYL